MTKSIKNSVFCSTGGPVELESGAVWSDSMCTIK